MIFSFSFFYVLYNFEGLLFESEKNELKIAWILCDIEKVNFSTKSDHEKFRSIIAVLDSIIA